MRGNLPLVRGELLYALYSGQLFFLAAGLLLAAMVMPKWIAGIAGMLAVALGVFSAPLEPAAALVLAFAFWAGSRKRSSRPMAILAAIVCAGAILVELPYHVRRRAIAAPSRIYVIGDSLASGGFGETMPWPQLLRARLRVPVTNLALASADTALAIEREVPLLGPAADDRELVLVEIGGNDMLDGLEALTFSTNLDQLLTAATDGRQAVMLELPLLPGRLLYGSIQRHQARKHGVTLLPKRILARVLTTPGFTSDGVHLTQEGHDALARAVAGHFNPAVPQPRR